MSDAVPQMAQELFDLNAHLGHRKNRLHPKARKYVYKVEDGTSIIDLEQTIAQIGKAKTALANAQKETKTLLIVATKKSVANKIAALAKEKGIASVTVKWLPGLLTNFDTIMKNVQKLKTMKEERANEAWDKYVKHEQIAMTKEMTKLQRLYGGIESLAHTPDMLLVVDIRREKNAVTEATQMHLPVVAIVDTNCDPDLVDYPVIVNDDSPDAIEYVVKELLG